MGLYICTFEHLNTLHLHIFTFAHYSVQLPTLYRLLPLPPNRWEPLQRQLAQKSCLCWSFKSTLWHFLELLWKWRCLGVAFTFIDYGNRCMNINTHKETLHADGWPLMLASAPLSISRINGPHWASSSVGLEHQRKLIKITSALSPRLLDFFSLFLKEQNCLGPQRNVISTIGDFCPFYSHVFVQKQMVTVDINLSVDTICEWIFLVSRMSGSLSSGRSGCDQIWESD